MKDHDDKRAMNGTGASADVIDDIDRHMGEAGSIARAAGPLGVYLAWCANLDLLSDELKQGIAGEVVRLRMRDLRPVEFLIKATAGSLRREHLNEVGLQFTERYYAEYLDDYAAALNLEASSVYDVEDSWANYDRVAPELTRRLYRRGRKRAKHWWQRFGGRKHG
jgi:hypothetical protein